MIDDESVPEAKLIAFMHNADICPKFRDPLIRYFQKEIQVIEPLIAQTEDRPSLWKKYKAAKTAILLNYLIATKGIDDSTTYGVMLGRGMVSLRGGHALQRGTTSHPDEYGLPQNLHIKKPFGVCYIPVVVGLPDSEDRLRDLKEMLRLLYSTGWKENIKIVDVPKPKKKDRDEEVKKPNYNQNNTFNKIFKVEEEIKKAIVIEKELYGKLQTNDRIKNITKPDDYFKSLRKAVA